MAQFCCSYSKSGSLSPHVGFVGLLAQQCQHQRVRQVQPGCILQSQLHSLEKGLLLSLIYFVSLEYSRLGILRSKELARTSLSLHGGERAIVVVSTNLVGFKCISLYTHAAPPPFFSAQSFSIWWWKK